MTVGPRSPKRSPSGADRRSAAHVVCVLLVALVSLAAASAASEGPPPRRAAPDPRPATPLSYRGVVATHHVPFARGPLPPPQPSAGRRAPRVAPWPQPPARRGLALPSAAPAAPSQRPPPSPAAPSLNTSFIGITDDNTVIPPDTMGTVGLNHLVSFLNNDIAVWNRAGTNLYQTGLETFMTVPLGLGTDAFDPHVLFDPHSSRFIGICANGPSGETTHDSNIALAVSATSDPTGSWYRWAIDADVDTVSGGSTQTDNWADFPSLGVDQSAVYITANMFRGVARATFQYVKVWCIPKAQLLTGSASISWTEFVNVNGALGTFALRPCVTYGATTSEYLVSTGWSFYGIEIWRIDDPTGTPTLTNTASPFLPAYDHLLANAPQLGGAGLIETNDDRMLDAEYRGGSIWCTHSIDVSNRTSVRWYQLGAASGAIMQQGTISDSARSYYYPSIAVNAAGDVALGFTGSSASEYASAFYTARAAGDPAGSTQAVSLLKAGEAYYYKTYSGTSNRWGDFSETCVDPAHDTGFWTIQEYAWTPGGGHDRWSTWWGNFYVSVPTAAMLPSLAAESGYGAVTLQWTTRAAVRVAGFNVLRGPSEAGPFEKLNAALIPSRGDPLAPEQYSFTDARLRPGLPCYYKLQQASADGSIAEQGPVAAVAKPTGLPLLLDGLTASLRRLWAAAVSPSQSLLP